MAGSLHLIGAVHRHQIYNTALNFSYPFTVKYLPNNYLKLPPKKFPANAEFCIQTY